MIQRALNQKTADGLSFEAFLDLAAGLGCMGVELRDDLGRPLFDGMDPGAAGRLAHGKGLRVLGLCEVYGFNDWTDARAMAVQSLIQMADAAGADQINLVPSVERERMDKGELRTVLRAILPLLEGTNVQVAIEPIGFTHSAVRDKAAVVEAIEAVGGGDYFTLVHDTFQHVIGGGGPIFPEHTAMVHISGITHPTATLDEAMDPHRVLVGVEDRCGTLDQIAAFLDAGYRGPFSFECTDLSVRRDQALGDRIEASFAHIERAVA